MRVLTITAAYPTHGSHLGAFLAREVDGLRQQGIDVTVMHLQGRAKYMKGMIDIFRESWQGRYDIIHGQYSFGGAVARAQFRLPTVISFWGTDVLRDPVLPDTLPNRVSRTISPWLARHVDAVTVPFPRMAEELHSSRVTVIPQGIDFARFHPMSQEDARQQLGMKNDPARRAILFCANPKWPRKGYDILADAVDLLKTRGQPAEIVVANGLPQEQVTLYMNACDVLAVPSSLESGPYVVKEAMACNLPIVSTDVGDVASIIANTEGCYLADRTPDAFADKLAAAFARNRRTDGAQHIAHLSREQLIGRIIAIYEQVLRQRGHHGAP
jgi:teichuronic acid biosynthesis glycosyltransferase TuaC